MTTIPGLSPRLKKQRKSGGFTTVALVLVLAFFVALPLGLLGFELARYSLMQQQLQSLADAAALAGTVQLANSNYSTGTGANYSTMIVQAENAAYNTFTCSNTVAGGTSPVQNSILQTVVNNTNIANNGNSPQTFQPAAHSGYINFYLFDVNGNPVVLGGTTPASVIQVQAVYSDAPIFAGALLPILRVETATANSYAGLPEIDVVLCFDTSASMDDSTPVKLIERYWDASANQKVQYAVVSPSTLTTDANNIQHPNIYDLAVPQRNGILLNIQPPQNLSAIQYPTGTPPSEAGSDYFYFTESSTTGAVGGQVPGNGAGSSFPVVTNNMCGLRGSTVTFPVNYLKTNVNPSIPAGSQTFQAAVAALGYQTISVVSEQGLPPGNYDPGSRTSWTGYSGTPIKTNNPSTSTVPQPALGQTGGKVYGFTDMIPFVTYPQTVNGFTFNSDADMVEASRGNLESNNLANLAIPDGNNPPTGGPAKAGVTVSIGTGAYLAYWDLVRQNAHPMSDALVSAGNFFTTLNTISNAHFSLVAYSDQIGTSTNSTEIPNGPSGSPWAYSPAYNIDPVYYIRGGDSTVFNNPSGWTPTLGWGMPYYALQSTDSPANSNYPNVLVPMTGTTSTTSSSQFPVTPVTVGPVGSTNMKAALQQGYTELQTGGGVRAHAQKTVIVLFTDGIPDYPSGAGGPDYGAFSVASTCKTAGIPIYTIGFSQNPAVEGTPGTNGQWTEIDVLGDGQNQSGQGISYLAGNGGAYFPVTNKTQLEQAFNQIASALVTLQYQNSN